MSLQSATYFGHERRPVRLLHPPDTAPPKTRDQGQAPAGGCAGLDTSPATRKRAVQEGEVALLSDNTNRQQITCMLPALGLTLLETSRQLPNLSPIRPVQFVTPLTGCTIAWLPALAAEVSGVLPANTPITMKTGRKHADLSPATHED